MNTYQKDDSDVEEEALVADYKEQVQYEGGADDLDQPSLAQQADDLQAQLVQAAQPLDFQATLDTKFRSYDNYCALFHYILNSENGPVDLEPPSVSLSRHVFVWSALSWVLTPSATVLLGVGCD
jgi:translation initiation factor 3 subunit L